MPRMEKSLIAAVNDSGIPLKEISEKADVKEAFLKSALAGTRDIASITEARIEDAVYDTMEAKFNEIPPDHRKLLSRLIELENSSLDFVGLKRLRDHSGLDQHMKDPKEILLDSIAREYVLVVKIDNPNAPGDEERRTSTVVANLKDPVTHLVWWQWKYNSATPKKPGATTGP